MSMSQVSRYEYEKMRHDQLTEKQLEEELTARGSNYAAVRHHHNIHKVGGGVIVTDGLTILTLGIGGCCGSDSGECRGGDQDCEEVTEQLGGATDDGSHVLC